MRSDLSPVQVNLQRLFRWHGLNNANVAQLLGSTPHTVGDWLGGKREPGAEYLILVAELFAINPRDLHGDPREFGGVISEPGRLEQLDTKLWRNRGYLLDDYGVAWQGAVLKAV
jgi:transcriptional regulator with XRE-family HTH domain